jgi:SAM-dependent methyltransferase
VKEEYLDIYPHLYRAHWWWRAREHAVKNLLQRFLDSRNNYRLLDVGCGEGLLFPVLSKFGSIEGVDPFVREEVASSLNIHRIPFDNHATALGEYDAILMLDFLEHLEDPEGALQVAHKMLKPAGLLFVTVPAFQCLWTSHDKMNNHQRRYTKKLLLSQTASSGFKVAVIDYFFHWVFFAKLLVRLKELILPPKPSQLPSIPAPLINSALIALSTCEYMIGQTVYVTPPFGGSIFMVARRE